MDAVLNFKTNKKLKLEAQKVAKDLGLPLGTIMNHYLNEFVLERKVLFTDHPKPTKAVVEELKKLSLDVKNKKNISPAFDNIEDAIAWLNN